MTKLLAPALLALASATMLLGLSGMAAAAPTPLVSISAVRVVSANALEGDTVTILVSVENNGSIDLVLANLTLTESTVSASGGSSGTPNVVGELTDVTLGASNITVFIFPWVAASGTHAFTAQAVLRQGNTTIPLPPVTTRASFEKPQIAEPLAVAADIAAVLAVVLAIAVAPALIERSRGGRR